MYKVNGHAFHGTNGNSDRCRPTFFERLEENRFSTTVDEDNKNIDRDRFGQKEKSSIKTDDTAAVFNRQARV